MKFRQHLEFKDRHSFLSASKYHWLNYDEEKLLARYASAKAAQRGTELHAYAHEAVRLGQKQPHYQQTVPMYVNDCIGFGMSNEVTLVYSENAFGTADAIKFGKRPNGEGLLLQIFDLKTGVVAGHPEQLIVYAAYFCLEYNVNPLEIDYDLRIYQNDEIVPIEVYGDEIREAMEIIKAHDKSIKRNNELEEV